MKNLIQQELYTRIKLIGVESGVIEISYSGTHIGIGFYDEESLLVYTQLS